MNGVGVRLVDLEPVLRGFDVLLLAAAPVLLAPGAFGAVLSICVSLVVLGYLAGRE